MTETILVTGNQSEANADLIRATAGDADAVFAPTLAEAGPLLEKATVIAGTLRPGQLERATHLRWVHSWAAGADNDLTPEMAASDVLLTSSTGNGGIPLAEQSMLLMLMLDRDVPRWQRAQAAHEWDRFTHGELNGRTVGIVGLGNAGADLARKAKAFHMRVLGTRRRAEITVPDVDRLYVPQDLREMLSECDFVVVTAPKTPATTGLFGEEEFRTMPKHSFFVCISRGGIADDDALLKALTRGWIAGAGLDAHGVEPLPSDSPFWDLPNVIVTPHNGATTAATAQRGVEIFLDNLRRYLAHEDLINIVDKHAGY